MAEEWSDKSVSYVQPRPRQTDAWTAETAQQGRRGTQQIREVAEVPAPDVIASALNLPSGEPVVVRRRLVLLDEQPYELADSYYPVTIARGTALVEPRKIPGGAVTLLADLGRLPHRIEEDVYTRPATADERDVLHLDEHEWVLVLTRLSRTHDGTPVEVSVMTMVARGRHLRYELPA
ncbi:MULTISPECIES: UTRA domain-containing protein [unclassified Nonomuraea]|uniref:UTRA domain-containing protein n=1 Tax=unclassified Nonomuraea TaxID=2593643 RepID=UPI00340EAC7C